MSGAKVPDGMGDGNSRREHHRGRICQCKSDSSWPLSSYEQLSGTVLSIFKKCMSSFNPYNTPMKYVVWFPLLYRWGCREAKSAQGDTMYKGLCLNSVSAPITPELEIWLTGYQTLDQGGVLGSHSPFPRHASHACYRDMYPSLPRTKCMSGTRGENWHQWVRWFCLPPLGSWQLVQHPDFFLFTSLR